MKNLYEIVSLTKNQKPKQPCKQLEASNLEFAKQLEASPKNEVAYKKTCTLICVPLKVFDEKVIK